MKFDIKQTTKRDKNWIVLSTAPSPHYKSLVYINECKPIIRPDKKQKIWITRCKYILDSSKIDIDDIVEMICKRHEYIYLAGVTRYSKVTKNQERKMESARTLFGIIQ